LVLFLFTRKINHKIWLINSPLLISIYVPFLKINLLAYPNPPIPSCFLDLQNFSTGALFIPRGGGPRDSRLVILITPGVGGAPPASSQQDQHQNLCLA
ncbi:MAG: hypothetical protein QGH15_17480, partial [Kiritimatiellia bacterium]|nr:hypothetical protein [Kiritimatiellia bacterium]